MRRLLQFGTFLFLLVTFVTPLMEYFDRWDVPGLANDAEFGLFALMMALCLVLIVMKLLSALALAIRLVSQRLPLGGGLPGLMEQASELCELRPPLLFPPLRI